MKKIITLAFAFCLATGAVYAALPVPQNSEVIEHNVESVELSELKQSKFEKIDLRPYANRSFVDNVAGDMTGGWSDQGPENDMRNFNLFGEVEILGIPFDVIPQGENGGKSVLAIRGKDNIELPKRVEIPYNKTAAGVYFLQSAPYAFSAGHYVGRYSFEYTDGTICYTDVLSSYEISDFFGSSVPKYGKTAWLGDNAYASANGYRINLSLLALKNPHPDKTIKNLVMETEGNSSFIMIVGLTFTDKGPYYLQDGDIALNPPTVGWAKAEDKDFNKSKGTSVDVSYLLDAPAGKHGFLNTKGDSFVFEDGTKAKFWGTNLYGKACFPEKNEAQNLADEIAQNGFNMVRMSGLDGDYECNIFSDGDNTLNLDPDSMDKLCYFIKCLKDKGIYVYLTVTSERPVLAGDGIEAIDDVAAGYKVEGFFDGKLIELQKDYLGKLLTYNNKYTSLAIGEDPAVAMIEYMDSNSMYAYSANPRSKNGVGSEYYFNQLNEKYNDFVREKYKTVSALKKAWALDYGIIDNNVFKNKGLSIYGAYQNSPIIGARHKTDIALFLQSIHKDYYKEMETVARKCGFKGVSTSHSNPGNEVEFGNPDSAFVAVNAFNSVNMGMGKDINPSVFDKGLGVVDDIVKSKMVNKPLMISGYNTGFGAKFTGDTVLAIAALSGQQGWSACQYYYTDGIDNKNNTFEIENDLTRLALMPAAAILNSSMEELKEDCVVNISASAAIPVEFNRINLPNVFDKKVSVSMQNSIFENLASEDNADKYSNPNFRTDADKHISSIRTSNTEAFVGVPGKAESFDHIDYIFNSAICAASLNALGGKDFESADRFLLTTVGRTRRQDQLTDEWFNITGEGDMVTEQVAGQVVLKLGKVRVYALNFSGERLWEMQQITDSRGNTIIPITKETSAVYYEIVRQ